MVTSTKRASERAGTQVDLKAPALRDLMTEQSLVRDGWATFYTGTPAQLAAAGIPINKLPQAGRKVKLQLNGMRAELTAVDRAEMFELAIHWGLTAPAHHGGEHPALGELSRMMHIAICYWSDSDTGQPDEVPTAKLIACRQAVDYRLPATKRFRFGPLVRRRIFSLQSQMYNLIREAEIFPMQPATDSASGLPTNVVSLRRKAR